MKLFHRCKKPKNRSNPKQTYWLCEECKQLWSWSWPNNKWMKRRSTNFNVHAG